MAFWNRNDDHRRRGWHDEQHDGTSIRDLAYGERAGVPTERGPNDRGDWARDRYGMADYGRGDDRAGYDRYDRERTYEGRPMDSEGRPFDTRGDRDRYDRADYRVGLGGWREQGRSMMDDRGFNRDDDRRFRSDMPGMDSRGDYGMDDYRRRGLRMDNYGRGYSRPAGILSDEGQPFGSFVESRNGPYGTAERQLGGRGPKNYTRSDERIRDDVCERLMQSWMNSEDVDVRVEKGEVTLTGFVDSRHEKRSIEDAVERVLGVKEVHNQLRMRRAEPRAEASSVPARSSDATEQRNINSNRGAANIPAGTATAGGNGTPVRS